MSAQLRIPAAPRSIAKGSTLKDLLDREAVDCLAENLSLVHPAFDPQAFRNTAMNGLQPLGIIERGRHIAKALRTHLPSRFEEAVNILLSSLTPPPPEDSDLGLAVFFYLPHSAFIAEYGLDCAGNGGDDPFEVSMRAQYEITRRFTAEFSIRPFIIRWPERTLSRLMEWVRDQTQTSADFARREPARDSRGRPGSPPSSKTRSQSFPFSKPSATTLRTMSNAASQTISATSQKTIHPSRSKSASDGWTVPTKRGNGSFGTPFGIRQRRASPTRFACGNWQRRKRTGAPGAVRR